MNPLTKLSNLEAKYDYKLRLFLYWNSIDVDIDVEARNQAKKYSKQAYNLKLEVNRLKRKINETINNNITLILS